MEPDDFIPSPPRTGRDGHHDLAVIGAGPVGLAAAIELSRLGLTVIVLDRRPPPDEDAGLRPQLLVARAGDLANLDHVGVDVDDRSLVSMLATRREADLASGRSSTGEATVPRDLLHRTTDLRELAGQPPLALVPIGALQRALAARAVALGATLRYRCEVTRLRRHARTVSLLCRDGTSVRAAMAVIATGASRALVEAVVRTPVVSGPAQRLVAGVFEHAGERAAWTRLELPVPGVTRPVRCTLLETPVEAGAGTALLVDGRLADRAGDGRLRACFAATARALGLGGAAVRVAPQVFTTAATSLPRRFVAGDGRAPVLITGDAAQTGHVFSGQTCFVNLALALDLCRQLRHARAALCDRKVNAAPLLAALTRFGNLSAVGAEVLARGSQRHLASHPPGGWALAGVARA